MIMIALNSLNSYKYLCEVVACQAVRAACAYVIEYVTKCVRVCECSVVDSLFNFFLNLYECGQSQPISLVFVVEPHDIVT